MSDEETRNESDMEEDDDDYANYYRDDGLNGDFEPEDPHKTDPEYFENWSLTDTEVERLFNESVEQLSVSIHVSSYMLEL